MKPFLVLLLSLLNIFCARMSLAHADQDCTYFIDTNSVEISWTAFKTTQKVAVQGSFTEVTLYGEVKDGFSVASLLGNLEAEINLKDKTKIHTGNEARDQTLFENFFNELKRKPIIKGIIKKVAGNNLQGDFLLDLTMNRKTLAIPMHYTRDEAGLFTAKGGIDLLDFALGNALNKLHLACEQLHKGPDGISKTWPLVDLRLVAKIQKKCK